MKKNMETTFLSKSGSFGEWVLVNMSFWINNEKYNTMSHIKVHIQIKCS